MKRFRSLVCGIAASMALLSAVPVQAGYTFCASFDAGGRGQFTDTGQIRVLSRDGKDITSDMDIRLSDGRIELSDLPYRAVIRFPDLAGEAGQSMLDLKDDLYHARGFKVSGQDNDNLRASFVVRHDCDYVVAYGVQRKDRTRYMVYYRDENGRDLAKAAEYTGYVGDKPVLSFAYVEGYRPQAYNLTKTLTGDVSDNEFVFTYRKLQTGGSSETNRLSDHRTGQEMSAKDKTDSEIPKNSVIPSGIKAAASQIEDDRTDPVSEDRKQETDLENEEPEELIDLDDEPVPTDELFPSDTQEPEDEPVTDPNPVDLTDDYASRISPILLFSVFFLFIFILIFLFWKTRRYRKEE